MEIAIQTPVGTLLLICSLGGESGAVKTTQSQANAEVDCSEGGALMNTSVVAVIPIS